MRLLSPLTNPLPLQISQTEFMCNLCWHSKVSDQLMEARKEEFVFLSSGFSEGSKLEKGFSCDLSRDVLTLTGEERLLMVVQLRRQLGAGLSRLIWLWLQWQVQGGWEGVLGSDEEGSGTELRSEQAYQLQKMGQLRSMSDILIIIAWQLAEINSVKAATFRSGVSFDPLGKGFSKGQSRIYDRVRQQNMIKLIIALRCNDKSRWIPMQIKDKIQMQRQLISQREDTNLAKCQICMNLVPKNTPQYHLCKNRHVICHNCLQGQIDHHRCPICLVNIQLQQDLKQQIFEMVAWDQVVQFGNDNQPEEREYSRANHFVVGAASSFGQFHLHEGQEPEEQPFFGAMKIDIRGYLALLGAQLALTILNFYFGLQRIDEQQCPLPSLSYHRTLTYQSWLMGVGILELIFMSFTLLFLLFYRGHCINPQEFSSCWKIIKTIFGIKIVFWSIVQLVIFIKGIPDYCTGGLHTFGMLNAILHVFLLSVVVAELGKLRKKMLTFALQFYIAFFNIYYGFCSVEELMEEQQFRNAISSYQGWMRAVGIFEVIFMLVVVLFFRLKHCGVNTGKMSLVMKLTYCAKIALWLCIQLYMLIFHSSTIKLCRGGLFFYSIVNTLLHIAFIVVILFKNK